MKKLVFAVLLTTLLASCGAKVYNSALKQIELGMTKEQVIGLMGDSYINSDEKVVNNKKQETLEYRDRFKNHWFFIFVDNSLVKWYKETEGK